MGPVKSFTHHRLELLQQKYNLHVMLNADKEVSPCNCLDPALVISSVHCQACPATEPAPASGAILN